MSDHRRRRLDRHTTERLLRGVPAESDSGTRKLSELLAAASAPTRPGELSGEQAATAAFRAAQLGTPLLVPSRPTRWATARRLLIVKVAAGVAGVTVAATAFAAGTGILPPLPGPFDDDPTRTPPPDHSSTLPRTGDGSNGPTPTRTPPPGATSLPPDSLPGLCRAYFARPPSARGAALKTPAFAALLRAAGDADNVNAYCTALVGAPPDKKPTDRPPTGPPTEPPNQAATQTQIPAPAPDVPPRKPSHPSR